MNRPVPPAIWFLAALAPMVASQVVRLAQTDPFYWIACDYAGRIGTLAVLAIIPAAREVAYRRERLLASWWEVALWIAVIIAADKYLGEGVRLAIDEILPNTRLGSYPAVSGRLHIVDVVIGLALVAISEEVLFRRCALSLFQKTSGDGLVLAATSVLFGAYHWWTGIGNVIATALIGALLMSFYLRARALWPVILAHYLTDIVYFA